MKKVGAFFVYLLAIVVILGMAARHMDYSVEDWYAAIEHTVKPKTIELNKKAFDAGYQLTGE